MKTKYRSLTKRAVVLWLSCALSAAAAQAGQPEQTAKEILDAPGLKGGLIVHVGCGDGKLTAALRAGESYLVQGLDTDAKAVQAASPSLPNGTGLVFTSGGKDKYVFDTGILRGEIRKDDLTLGLSSLVHVPSGTKVSGKYGVFSYYRVFTTNQRYGHAAWEWPSVSKLLPDGAVQIVWPAEPNYPSEIAATYRLSGQAVIDVETSVKAQKDLPHFEVFLASYFTEAFPASRVYVDKNPKAQDRPGFMAAEKSFGDWLMFPRAEDMLPIIRDGRWDKEPNPVKWTVMPCLAAPIGVRQTTAGNLAVVLMAPPEDCFAISTPYEGEGHYSTYLSLFGRDLRAGQVVKAHCRLVVAAGLSDDQILALYKEYAKGFAIYD